MSIYIYIYTYVFIYIYVSWNSIIPSPSPPALISRARALISAGVVLPGSFSWWGQLEPIWKMQQSTLLNYCCHLIFCWVSITEYQTFQRPLKLVEMTVPKLLDMLGKLRQLIIVLFGVSFNLVLQISRCCSVECCQCLGVQCTFGHGLTRMFTFSCWCRLSLHRAWGGTVGWGLTPVISCISCFLTPWQRLHRPHLSFPSWPSSPSYLSYLSYLSCLSFPFFFHFHRGGCIAFRFCILCLSNRSRCNVKVITIVVVHIHSETVETSLCLCNVSSASTDRILYNLTVQSIVHSEG